MRNSMMRYLVFAGLALVLGGAAGCAKKTAAIPPPTPTTTTESSAPRDTTPTPPPSTENIPTDGVLKSSDLGPAFFDLDSYTLRADARAALDADARKLRDNPTANITIEGHCDERGTVEYNQALGERRAQAARDYLANAGIGGGRMQTVSYGKERPFDPGHDESAWQQNRRAHLVLR